MSAYDNVRLPEGIERGFEGGPGFAVSIARLASGFEQRNLENAFELAEYEAAYPLAAKAKIDTVMAFFRARRGALRAFRFRDWGDYQVTAAPFGTGDGTTTVFPLTLRYSDSGATYTRRIARPAEEFAVAVAGAPTEVTVGPSGLVTFGTAPADGAALTWSGAFDLVVRFDADFMVRAVREPRHAAVRAFRLVEVRLEDPD